jgi:diaminopimelate decarboxylase
MAATASYPPIRTQIGNVSVAELARQFGTPVYVYDAEKIRQRVTDLRAFEYIRYAQKACANLAILDLIRRLGVLVDAVSAGEIQRAIAAGYATSGDPPPIVYTADLFDRDALELVAKHRLHVNCGSADMLEQLAERCGGQPITLRINPGFGHGHSQKTNTGGESSKHGIWHEDLDGVLAAAKRLAHTIVGLHVHIGSGSDMEHLAQVCGAMEKLAARVGGALHSISAGGGLPIPYRDGEPFVEIAGYHRLWDATRRKLEKAVGHSLHLELEPGRYLVAESGFLVTEIRAIKRQGSNTFYLIDAGFNNLARPILYGAYHSMSICPADAHPVGRTGSPSYQDRPQHDVVVGGPLCESGDIFTQSDGGFVSQRRLPEAKVGEHLVIECAGAYGYVMASNYNSKPLVAEVLVDGGRALLVRARQTFEDIVRGEVIPRING